MKLTDSARNAIIDVMENKRLSPKEWYLEFRILENGAIGLGFTKERLPQVIEFGLLRLTIEEVIDTEGVLVDFGEIDGRQGLLFGSEEQVTAAASAEAVITKPDPTPPSSSNGCGGACGSGGCDGSGKCNGDCGPNCKCQKEQST